MILIPWSPTIHTRAIEIGGWTCFLPIEARQRNPHNVGAAVVATVFFGQARGEPVDDFFFFVGDANRREEAGAFAATAGLEWLHGSRLARAVTRAAQH